MALVFKKQVDEKTAIGLWRIEEDAQELISRLQLKHHETDTLLNLSAGKRRLHWLSTRVLLRHLLGDPAYIDCRIDDHGKPYLSNFPHRISLSHSYNYAAVMVSEDKDVGIDIEQISNKIERIAGKFMKDEELAFIASANRTQHLYICWCAKEAIYKLRGKTGVSFKEHIHLKRFAVADEGSFDASFETHQLCRMFKVHYEKFEDYMIGYCAAERLPDEE
jgi:phosphopantetheinyl transferase